MADERKKPVPTQESGVPQQVPPLTFGTVWTGMVGLTKAALHVERAEEPVIRKRRSLCAACPTATAGSSRTSRCLACTCFIHPKTATATEKCPFDNW